MRLESLKRHAEAMFEVQRDLVLGRYPEFVTGGALPRGHVPVFVFHKLDPEVFGRKVRYLADNGYVTLSADEYFQFLVGGRPAPENAVVLTFDDGWSSVRSVGLPLLRRYGMRGIVFVVPGRIASRPGPLPPTWDEVRSGSAKGESVLSRDDGEDGFLAWEEIGDLCRSGLFDFESHSLSHARVHTAPHLAGFLAPESRRGYGPLDVPLVRDGERDLLAAQAPLGTPLFRSEPRLSEALRFYEDPRVREACVARVAEEGEGFFYRKGWERELRRLMNRTHLTGRVETPEERGAAIRRELLESKRLLEERTGRPVLHLCYPWHVAGETARRVAREVGYRTAFCGKVKGVPITLQGSDPHRIARIGEDYVELLPGRGRSDLTTVLRRKLQRRLGAAAAES
ncbi:MAG TPA: polysaccharide deacetylase family protein [Vicinamibacteria bacterium]|nr:polysaccharide deacetylase family protein [Vicinamibacteria bacterium]